MMRRLPTVLAATAAALTTTAATASAAQIALDRACYADPGQRKDTIALTGSGFTPNAPFQLTLDGQALPNGTGMTDAAGALAANLAAPSLADYVPKTERQHTFMLGVQEGTTSQTVPFTVSKLLASFAPASGNPKTLKVRFSLSGFALSGAVNPATYVHYVRPNGKLKKTYRLGTAQGPCGALRTSRRRLFPFRAERGGWKLQFDTAAKYTRGTSSSTFLFYTVGVTVKRS